MRGEQLNNYVKLLNNLENLELKNMKSNIDQYIEMVNSNDKSVVDALYELSELEIKAKKEKAMNACVKVASFPFLKTLNDFDFDFQPIIDEIGYLPIDLDASNLFFQLIAKRYEKHCTIITTNSNFSKWPDIFGSPTIANAILDRLLHHSHIISIKGPSYRIQSKIQYLDNDSMKDSEMP